MGQSKKDVVSMVDGQRYKDDRQLAEELNKHFISVSADPRVDSPLLNTVSM